MRNRSLALVIRENKILIVQTYRFGRYTNELPGGGIEPNESPEDTAIRELFEECGVCGKILRPLNVLHREDGSIEYVFLVEVQDNEEIHIGYDPEIPEGQEQEIRNVCWMSFEEFSERDKAFLWSYGLMDVPGPWRQI
jgi:8-oxo-dGTP pyrophosphatase MutT (NUDIX family)